MTKVEKTVKGLRFCIANGACNKSECPYLEECYNVKADSTPVVPVMRDALMLLDDGDRLKVVRCHDCIHWKPSNAEEGDSSGKCRRYFGMCENATTDAMCFCSEGERE